MPFRFAESRFSSSDIDPYPIKMGSFHHPPHHAKQNPKVSVCRSSSAAQQPFPASRPPRMGSFHQHAHPTKQNPRNAAYLSPRSQSHPSHIHFESSQNGFVSPTGPEKPKSPKLPRSVTPPRAFLSAFIHVHRRPTFHSSVTPGPIRPTSKWVRFFKHPLNPSRRLL